MTKIKEGFKVLRKKEWTNGIDPFSCFSPVPLPYPKNTRIYHKLGDGYLTIFNTFKNAKIFLAGRYSHTIFSAVYKPIQNKKKFVDNNIFYSLPIGRKYRKKFFIKNVIPKGTQLARWIKLIERVY